MYRIKILNFALLLLLLSACAGSTTPVPTVEGSIQQVVVDGGSYIDVNVAELQTMLGDKDFTFVNVHIPFEGDIPGTDISIPYDEIAQHLDNLPEKDAKIVLYCRSGRMSEIAAETLVGLGYTDVWNLMGGMVEWEKSGLEIQR